MKEKKYTQPIVKTVDVNPDLYQIKFIMSTNQIDRHGEIIDQKGWDFNPFLSNPVVLFGHDQSLPSVGKVVSIEIVDGKAEGIVQFAYNENPMAKTLYELYKGGYMNAVSVGFMNKKWMYDEVNDIVTLLENELFELSLVNVPANAGALAIAKSKGIDVDQVKNLFKSGTYPNDERFKNLGEQEVVPEKEDEEIVDPVVEGTEDTEKVVEDTEEATDEPQSTEEEVKKAFMVIANAPRELIMASVKELNRLNDALNDNNNEQVDTAHPTKGVKKGFSNSTINFLVRSLMNSKKE
jgi:HK97 family phage prohead protease